MKASDIDGHPDEGFCDEVQAPLELAKEILRLSKLESQPLGDGQVPYQITAAAAAPQLAQEVCDLTQRLQDVADERDRARAHSSAMDNRMHAAAVALCGKSTRYARWWAEETMRLDELADKGRGPHE